MTIINNKFVKSMKRNKLLKLLLIYTARLGQNIIWL